MRFSQSIYNVNESDRKIDVTLYHSNPSSVNITLRVSSDHVSTGKYKFDDDNFKCYKCIDVSDYNAGPYTAIIPAGENDVTFSVPINDDNIREESETFNLIINNSLLPSGVTSSDPSTVTVTIMDNDSK